MHGTMNSHIQIPRFLLRNFEDQEGTLYQLDAKSMIINRGHARTINTKKGYFSNEIENMMQQYFESPFSKLLKSIQNPDSDTSHYDVPDDFEKIIKKFVLLTMARTPEMYESIVSNAVYARFVSVNEDDKADIAVETCMTLGVETVFDSFTIAFLHNRSVVPFVLPICGLYNAPFMRHSCMVYPMTPHFAILLIKGTPPELIDDKGTKPVVLYNANVARKLNCSALLEQRCFECYEKLGNNKVIGNGSEVLQLLVNDFWAVCSEETQEKTNID